MVCCNVIACAIQFWEQQGKAVRGKAPCPAQVNNNTETNSSSSSFNNNHHGRKRRTAEWKNCTQVNHQKTPTLPNVQQKQTWHSVVLSGLVSIISIVSMKQDIELFIFASWLHPKLFSALCSDPSVMDCWSILKYGRQPPGKGYRDRSLSLLTKDSDVAGTCLKKSLCMVVLP